MIGKSTIAFPGLFSHPAAKSRRMERSIRWATVLLQRRLPSSWRRPLRRQTPSLTSIKGKQIRFVIRAAPGGNYDLYMRLLARYMVRYLPGSPEAIPVNMPGGGRPDGTQLHNQRCAARRHRAHDGDVYGADGPGAGQRQIAKHRFAVAPVDREHERRKLLPRNEPRVRN